MGCSASHEADGQRHGDSAAAAVPAGPFHPDPTLEHANSPRRANAVGGSGSLITSKVPSLGLPAGHPVSGLSSMTISRARSSMVSSQNPLSVNFTVAALSAAPEDDDQVGDADDDGAGPLAGIEPAAALARPASVEGHRSDRIGYDDDDDDGDDDEVAAAQQRLHAEVDDAIAFRGESPALTMDELPTEMHLQRIEGRGNMARMHGYTADIHQFPTPGALPREDQRDIRRKCRRWLRDVSAPSLLAMTS